MLHLQRLVTPYQILKVMRFGEYQPRENEISLQRACRSQELCAKTLQFRAIPSVDLGNGEYSSRWTGGEEGIRTLETAQHHLRP